MSEDAAAVGLGATVYDEDGEKLGTIRGFDDDGFYVTARGGFLSLSSPSMSNRAIPC
ncbi:PRC-barrel domain-containing protein [Halobacterium hubeiense]|uniref:PRC-barrel domain-containing protein n=1 Tax=Halobacterium hubeiense TaxID=1407499 RepID=UPI003C757293